MEIKFPSPKKMLINELIASLRERMLIIKDGQIVDDTTTIHLSFYSMDRKRDKHFNIKLGKKKTKVLSEESVQKILEIIEHRTRLVVKINGFDFYRSVSFIDNYAPYEPPVFVQDTIPELFDFQLLEPINGKTVLRTDTTQKSRTFSIYKRDTSVKIIHIPNFKTASRTVDEKNENDLEKVLAATSSYPPSLALKLPEFTAFNPKEMQLFFGGLLANPSGRNYRLDYFSDKKGKLKLVYKGKKVEILSCRLTIFDANKNPRIFSIDKPHKKNWLVNLEQVTYEQSIYFDKLIIKIDQQSYYLAQTFLFKIGKVFLKIK